MTSRLRTLRDMAIGAALTLAAVGVYPTVSQSVSQALRPPAVPISYQTLLKRIDAGQIRRIDIRNDEVTAEDRLGRTYTATTPLTQDDLLKSAKTAKVDVNVHPSRPGLILGVIEALLPR